MSESLVDKLARLEKGVAEVRAALDKQNKSKPVDSATELKELKAKVDKLLLVKPIDIEAVIKKTIKETVTETFITKLYKG